MNVEVLRPTVSFIASSGGKIARREALVIYSPFKAIIDPVDFWDKANGKTAIFTSPVGVTVSVNPDRVVTVTMKPNIKAIKVAVTGNWKDIVAIPMPLAVGVKVKKRKKNLYIPVKYTVKNGAIKTNKKTLRIPLSHRIKPGKGKLVLSFGVRKRRRRPHRVVVSKRKRKTAPKISL